MTVLKKQTWKRDQSLCGERIEEAYGRTVRAEVRRNAYDEQSWARVSAWTEVAGWVLVTTKPIEDTAVFGFSYVSKDRVNGWEIAILDDLADLTAEAFSVLPTLAEVPR